MRRWTIGLVALLVISACGSDGSTPTASTPDPTTPPTQPTDEQQFPDVIDAVATFEGNGTYRFDVTISSPYDTPERYADAWRIVGEDGTVHGIRELTHDHAAEQPFTRSLGGVEIPAGVTVVSIEGRDRANGWGGTTFEVTLPVG